MRSSSANLLDLASSDYHLFKSMHSLSDERFSNAADVRKWISINGSPQDDFSF